MGAKPTKPSRYVFFVYDVVAAKNYVILEESREGKQRLFATQQFDESSLQKYSCFHPMIEFVTEELDLFAFVMFIQYSSIVLNAIQDMSRYKLVLGDPKDDELSNLMKRSGMEYDPRDDVYTVGRKIRTILDWTCATPPLAPKPRKRR